MQTTWRIPQETEKPFRAALDHASMRRVSELHSMLERLPEDQLAGAVGLCGLATAYTAIDVVERMWPTDAQLRRIAERTVAGENPDEQFGVTEQNVYLWLSQVAFGLRAYSEVFGDLFDDPYKFLAAPFFFTINLLARSIPKGTTVGDFLNLIENAYEGAGVLDLNLLPALMVRARLEKKAQEASDEGQ